MSIKDCEHEVKDLMVGHALYIDSHRYTLKPFSTIKYSSKEYIYCRRCGECEELPVVENKGVFDKTHVTPRNYRNFTNRHLTDEEILKIHKENHELYLRLEIDQNTVEKITKTLNKPKKTKAYLVWYVNHRTGYNDLLGIYTTKDQAKKVKKKYKKCFKDDIEDDMVSIMIKRVKLNKRII